MQSILPIYLDQFSVFCAGLLLCMISLLFKGVYNRYFHPLAGYPGPFWATVTDFYKFYTINSIPTLGLKLHDTYGPFPTSIVHLSMTDSSRASRSHSPKPTIVLRPSVASGSLPWTSQ